MLEVQTKEVEPLVVMSLSFTGPYEQTKEKMEALMSWLLRVGHPYSDTPFALYYDDPAKVPADQLRAEVCLPIEESREGEEEIIRKEVPGGTMACAVHKAPPALMPQTYEQVFEWLQANGYRYIEGEPVRVLFIDIDSETDEEDECTAEVQVPVEKSLTAPETDTPEAEAPLPVQ